MRIAVLMVMMLAGCATAVTSKQLAEAMPDAVYASAKPADQVLVCADREITSMDWGICPDGATKVFPGDNGSDLIVTGQRGAYAVVTGHNRDDGSDLQLRVSPAAKATACGLLKKFKSAMERCS